MKLKSGFMLHSVGDENVVIPVGERTVNFRAIIKLNSSSAYVWEHMQGEFTVEGLVAALRQKYEVPEEVATADVKAFLKTLADAGMLEE